MDLHLHVSEIKSGAHVEISGSKSETNRLLLLQALFPQIAIENASDSDDSRAMRHAIASRGTIIDVQHAGTAMRFLTAYFSIQQGRQVVLTGSPRMKQRPIGVLADALRQLGAQIEYLETDGFPPLKITGEKLCGGKVTLKADVSSQFISALLLIAPRLENGIEIILEGEITSIPYIKMTLALLGEMGMETGFERNKITVSPCAQPPAPCVLRVESDWSSASYFYSIVALSPPGTEITLSSYRSNSLQGDSALAEVYRDFGIATTFSSDNEITIRKTGTPKNQIIERSLSDTPDIAQTLAVTCFGLGLGCRLTGLHTLKIKETDRLEALRAELEKLGATVSVTGDSLMLEPASGIHPDIRIATYHDHRMAMAFAPLALKVPIVIEDAGVVSKSYPGFWEDLEHIGFWY